VRESDLADLAKAIDRHAAAPDLPPQLGAAIAATSDRLLASIARDAIISLSYPERVRTCAAADCERHVPRHVPLP
jgi:hypothetical protein